MSHAPTSWCSHAFAGGRQEVLVVFGQFKKPHEHMAFVTLSKQVTLAGSFDNARPFLNRNID